MFQYLIGFILLLLVILWLFQTVFLEDFYKYIKQQEIRRDAAAFAGYVQQGDYEALQVAASHGGDLYVELWSPAGGAMILAGDSPQNLPSQYPSMEKERFWREAEENGGSAIKRFFNTSNKDRRRKESILHLQLLETPAGEALLLVNANISPVNATVDTLRIQLYCISGIMLLLAVALALLISKRVSKPIETLNESAKQLLNGKADFHAEGYREIQELSQTLEHTARELLKTDRLRQELIANVSHDLRTPLTLIAGYGEMIRDFPEENTAENVQVIIDESRRLTSLVTNLLDLSRLEAGVGEMQMAPFSLTEQVQRIIARFAGFSKQEGYTISFVQGEEATVCADQERIAQVIYNFISNALTYAGEDKTVRVEQIVKDGRVMIEVRDSGEGITQAQLPDIWERYYKADITHKRNAMGTGLGLSIVKSILEQHPGVEYGARSAPGEGSVFWFSLPLA